MQVRKQQLELDMEQQTGSKSGKDYFKVIYCHPAYLTYVEYITREGDGTPLQYSCLENPMDGGAWLAADHGVVKSRTRLRDFTFTFPFHALEKEMASHSSVPAWRIPGMAEPGRLPLFGVTQSRTRLK